MERDKREIRQLKRDIKRAGGKRARRQLKLGLAEAPEDAHEGRPDYGRNASAALNGLDRDSTRKRAGRDAEAPDDSWRDFEPE